MAEDKKEVKEKKSKKDKDGKKKEKRSDKDGVRKSKKDKKVKTATNGDAATALLETLDVEKRDVQKVVMAEDHVDVVMRDEPPIGALVPFANPLADDKVQKKVLKSVRKGMHSCACSRAAIRTHKQVLSPACFSSQQLTCFYSQPRRTDVSNAESRRSLKR